MTTTKPTRKATTPTKTRWSPKDAIALLRADHHGVNQMFAEYEKTRSIPNKRSLVTQICTTLSVHAQIEEEILYPAVKAALKGKMLLPEAMVEHGGVKSLIAELEGIEAGGEMYDAKVKVLSEYVKHHVKEEQNEMFPMVKSSSIDIVELGARMALRKDELLAMTA